jgi:hypothetical protein
MATEQDTFPPPPWQQLLQQQQLQQAPQSEPADLVTYHESDPRPGEEGYEEEEAPNIRSEPEPRQNAVVEGDFRSGQSETWQAQREKPFTPTERDRIGGRRSRAGAAIIACDDSSSSAGQSGFLRLRSLVPAKAATVVDTLTQRSSTWPLHAIGTLEKRTGHPSVSY